MTDLRTASRAERRAAAAQLRQEAQRWPVTLEPIPESEWPARLATMKGGMPVEIWRSRFFLLQVYAVSNHLERLSVNRCAVDSDGHWTSDISWEELQDLKRQCGRGDLDAVEIFPADKDIVNVANMRHLWVFRLTSVPFAWREKA